jgi:colicin import membrane protein
MATKKTTAKSAVKTKKSAALLKAEKADKAAKAKAAKEKREAAAAAKAEKAAKAKAAKEKREAAAAEKAAAAASKELAKAKKAEIASFSSLVRTAYSKAWKRAELIDYVNENFENVENFELNNKQIAFKINGTRVPSEGYFRVD